MLVLSMFSVVGFNTITIIICRPKSNQIEIILSGPNLTIIGSHKSNALNSVSTYNDPEILIYCSGPLNFTLKLKESTDRKEKNQKEKKTAEGKKKHLLKSYQVTSVSGVQILNNLWFW